mmetsp:Transcript_29293/g.69863  ORF Transcript_29293/g.69863 Transcript_29293/m.69863 type:complete len:127 (-) Transcript_29293:62-442(-)
MTALGTDRLFWFFPLLLILFTQLQLSSSAELSVQFDSGTTESECSRVMFIWGKEGRNLQDLEQTMEKTCDRINSSQIPGKGCRVLFKASAKLPSIVTELEGCCGGETAGLLMSSYPGIRLCRDLPS